MNNIIRFLLFCLTLFIFSSHLFGRQTGVNKAHIQYSYIYDSLFQAQNWHANLNKQLVPLFGTGWRNRILKAGDKFNISALGSLIGTNGKQVKIEDFKDKILILDFWATWCKSCVALMPHMNRLQKRFEKDVQILFVDVWEDSAAIKSFLKRKNIKFDLPILVGSKELMAAFPTQSIPYHVWIDKQGVVRLVGSSINTHVQKIQDLIDGKSIKFVEDENTVARFDHNIPYYEILKRKLPSSDYYSFFTEYNPYYAAFSGGRIKGFVDSTSRKVRNTFINMTLLELFEFAYSDDLKLSNIVFSPHYANIVISIPDTLSITDDFLQYEDRTDDFFIRSRYCYEQEDKIGTSVSEMKANMKKDLDTLGQMYQKIKATLTKVPVKALVIKRKNSQKEEAGKRVKWDIHSSDTFSILGKDVVRYRNISVGEALQSSAVGMEMFKELKKMKCFLLDGLEGEKENYVILPKSGNLMETLNLLDLQGYEIKSIEYKPTLLLVSR